MKKFILPFLFVLFFTLTSCGTQWSITTYSEPYPVQWVDMYDFNRIHWLYLNHPQWVWTNYYTHPFFVQYRTDCLRRGIYVQPYHPNRRFTNHRRSVVRNDRPIRYNSGRSNLNYNRTQRYSSARSNSTRVQRSTPIYKNYSQGRSTQMRRNNTSVQRTPTRSYSRSPSTTSRGRSSGVRSSSRSSGRRNN
jgi:hypothetical protein